MQPFNECKQLFGDDGQRILLVAAMQMLHWTLIPNHVSKTIDVADCNKLKRILY